MSIIYAIHNFSSFSIQCDYFVHYGVATCNKGLSSYRFRQCTSHVFHQIVTWLLCVTYTILFTACLASIRFETVYTKASLHCLIVLTIAYWLVRKFSQVNSRGALTARVIHRYPSSASVIGKLEVYQLQEITAPYIAGYSLTLSIQRFYLGRSAHHLFLESRNFIAKYQ